MLAMGNDPSGADTAKFMSQSVGSELVELHRGEQGLGNTVCECATECLMFFLQD